MNPTSTIHLHGRDISKPISLQNEQRSEYNANTKNYTHTYA